MGGSLGTLSSRHHCVSRFVEACGILRTLRSELLPKSAEQSHKTPPIVLHLDEILDILEHAQKTTVIMLGDVDPDSCEMCHELPTLVSKFELLQKCRKGTVTLEELGKVANDLYEQLNRIMALTKQSGEE